jgi:uncharacterized metal-binding protein
MTNWTAVGHGALIVFACVGAAAGAVAASVPSLALPAGAVSAACVAVVGALGRYLPSASATVNQNAALRAAEKEVVP